MLYRSKSIWTVMLNLYFFASKSLKVFCEEQKFPRGKGGYFPELPLVVLVWLSKELESSERASTREKKMWELLTRGSDLRDKVVSWTSHLTCCWTRILVVLCDCVCACACVCSRVIVYVWVSPCQLTKLNFVYWTLLPRKCT